MTRIRETAAHELREKHGVILRKNRTSLSMGKARRPTWDARPATTNQLANLIAGQLTATYTITAANGDTVVVEMIPQGTPPMNGIILFAGTWSATGGTGRFTGLGHEWRGACSSASIRKLNDGQSYEKVSFRPTKISLSRARLVCDSTGGSSGHATTRRRLSQLQHR
jgi:hypothetical protein